MFEKMKTKARVKGTGIVGKIVGVDLINNTVALQYRDINDELDTMSFKFDEIEPIEKAFELFGNNVYDGDVLIIEDGSMFLVNVNSGGHVSHDFIDKSTLEIVEIGTSYCPSDEYIRNVLEKLVVSVRSYNELVNERKKDFSFNIKVTRCQSEDGEVEYYYACNNKPKNEIDLIKVIFIGHNLLKEEEYNRITVSYDEYKELLNKEEIKEVSPYELANYVTGLTYNDSNEQEDEPEEDQEDSSQSVDSGYEFHWCGNENCCGNLDSCEDSSDINYDCIDVDMSTEQEQDQEDKRDGNEKSEDREDEDMKECNKCGYPNFLCDCSLF